MSISGINTSTPNDTDSAGAGAGQIRDFKKAVKDVFEGMDALVTEPDGAGTKPMTSATLSSVPVALQQLAGGAGNIAAAGGLSWGRGIASSTKTGTGVYQVTFDNAAASTTAQSAVVSVVNSAFAVTCHVGYISSTVVQVATYVWNGSAMVAVDIDFSIQRQI